MAETMTGGCACGRVRYSTTIQDDDAHLCHCRMCQRATGSISIAFKVVKQADVDWEREPEWYDSSAIALRSYCRECGTSLGFKFKEGSEHMDLTVASFDDPGRFRPVLHYGAEHIQRAWLNTEGLPEKRSDEHQPVADRWIAAAGRVPE